ncbi:MAG: amidohydrolase family protein [Archangium sp.]
MATLLRGATIVDVEPANVEQADLRIEGDRIVERAPSLEPKPGDEVIELKGKLLFPGLVSAQHHLHATLLRGLARSAPGYAAELALRQTLEETIDGDELEAAATAGGLEGLFSGTTTVFDTTASKPHVTGALSRIAHGLNPVGMRAVLSFEVSDRFGAMLREEALEECVSYAQRARGRFRGAIGLGSFSSLSDDAIAGVREARKKTNQLLLARIAEDPREETSSRERFGATAAERLVEAEQVGGRVVLSHGVHLTWPELSQLISAGTWLVHAPRSNMWSQTGHATVAKFGVRGCFGTDTQPLDVFSELQVGSMRTVDAAQPIDALRFIANGHRLASEAWGITIGPLQPGSAADLLVLDYHAPTVLDASTLAGHVLSGFGARTVESVMVDGLWRLWKRKALALDVNDVQRNAHEAARAVWARMREAGVR